jgi:hypothetical protein
LLVGPGAVVAHAQGDVDQGLAVEARYWGQASIRLGCRSHGRSGRPESCLRIGVRSRAIVATTRRIPTNRTVLRPDPEFA